MESIPDDIQKDILIRLPLKSLLACIFMCKKWKTMIYDEDFKDGYLLRSMTRPMDPTPHSLFQSVCRQQQERCQITAPIRGVVCLQTATRFVLCNPITNNILPLPDFDGRAVVSSHPLFLGYDEATSVYKVTWQCDIDRHLVYTVGGEGSWRTIACDPPHHLVPSAMCKGGVLYYAAITLPKLAIIISFNVSSEALETFPLPEEVFVHYDSKMVNYNGRVALVNNKSKTGEFQICVRNEVSGQWEFQRLVIPGWRDSVGNNMLFSFVGTIGTGQLVFTAPALVDDGSESILYYKTDPPQGSKMYRIEADNGGSYHYVRACLNNFYCLLRGN